MYQPLDLTWLAQQRILIVGLAREGRSTYHFLRHHFPDLELWCTDDQPLDKLDSEWQQSLANDSLLHWVAMADALAQAQPTLIFKTPGLPPSHPLVQAAQAAGLTFTSNTQLFFDLIKTAPDSDHRFQVIGVTGTKGKSTTSSLLYHLARTASLPSVLGGNIGVPPLDLWAQLRDIEKESTERPARIILELSAHQLADLHTSPHVAVIQNIVPEHLDYYASFEEYVAAKSQLTRFQTEHDWVVFNPDFEQTAKLAALSPGRQLLFSHHWQPELRAYVQDGFVWSQDPTTQTKTQIIAITDIPLKGEHNLQNVMPSVVMAQSWGVAPEVLKTAIQTFKALEHRLEFVAEVHGVKYYNDSMSTMPGATIEAVKAFADQPLILIAGGHDRHLDFSELGRQLAQSPWLKKVILFPPTGERIWETTTQAAQDAASDTQLRLPEQVMVETMAAAIAAANQSAKPGDVVLLSPASASFGLFTDYRDRGQQFKSAVNQLLLDQHSD